MKSKILSCVAAIAIIMFFASCEYQTKVQGPGINVTGRVDTGTVVNFPDTVPLYSCGAGKKTGYNKVKNWVSAWSPMAVPYERHLTNWELNAQHYFYDPTRSAGIDGPVDPPAVVNTNPPYSENWTGWSGWGSFWDFFWPLFLIALAIMFLVWLGRRMFPPTPPAPPAPAAVPPTPPAPGVTPIPSINDFRLILNDMLGKTATFSYSNNGATVNMATEFDPNAKPAAKPKVEKTSSEQPKQ